MKAKDLQATAVQLYGPNLADTAYILKLAKDLNASTGAVRMWWYERQEIPDAVSEAVDLLVRAQAGGSAGIAFS